MQDESVKREGRLVTVTIGGVSCTRSYSRESGAKAAEYRLLMSKRARENFFTKRAGGRRSR